RRPLRARALHQGRGGAAPERHQRRRRRARARSRRGYRAGDGPLQSPERAGLRGIAMTRLWEATIAAESQLSRWIERGGAELRVARPPRAAWPVVAGSVARALAARGRSV